ncbi:unnamed protein product [Cyprideis torosa]|uniref:Uncharacterized protein n=1 Tax=Cyprideis torosa TaxID=163714 RepID=A0A7R8WLF6_9CRUS|nr:unnamed protein product [Cyprideis torosa]CAG0898144.1 unnamed protein product [Cyprideis torosa]
MVRASLSEFKIRMKQTSIYVIVVLLVLQTVMLLIWYSGIGGDRDVDREKTSSTLKSQRNYLSKVLNEFRQKDRETSRHSLNFSKLATLTVSIAPNVVAPRKIHCIRFLREEGGDWAHNGPAMASSTWNEARRLASPLHQVNQLAQAECKLQKEESKTSISSSGGWCAEFSGKDSGRHAFDKPVAKALSTFLAGKRVASFGDGPGQYQQLVTEEGKVLSYAAFDGAPFTEQTSENRVKFLDLAIPHFGLEVFDWIVSLEVAEHIPEQFEATYLDNIFRHAREGIILSWAVPKQGGTGHANLRPFSYVRDVMAKAGFAHDEAASQQLKNAATLSWLKANINVYRRTVPFTPWDEVMA